MKRKARPLYRFHAMPLRVSIIFRFRPHCIAQNVCSDREREKSNSNAHPLFPRPVLEQLCAMLIIHHLVAAACLLARHSLTHSLIKRAIERVV